MNCVICNKEIERSGYSHKVICSSECFNTDYWNERVAENDNPTSVRINGEQYWIGDENSMSSFRGFGGAKHIIKFFDGREVTTTNLWYNGVVPEDFKELLPDNAEFAKANNTYLDLDL